MCCHENCLYCVVKNGSLSSLSLTEILRDSLRNLDLKIVKWHGKVLFEFYTFREQISGHFIV